MAGDDDASALVQGRTLRLAVVGDVHGQFDEALDGAAVSALAPDAVMLVGDFGEELVELVSGLAEPRAGPPRIVILGNHDAWTALTSKGRERAAVAAALEAAGLPPRGRGARPKERPQPRELRRAVESAAALASERAEEEARAAAAAGRGVEDPAALGPKAWAQLRALGGMHAGYSHWGGLLPSAAAAGAAAAAAVAASSAGAAGVAGAATAAGAEAGAARAVGAAGATGATGAAAAAATARATSPACPPPPPPPSLVSVVGARPFSKGGDSFAACERFYRAFYGVATARESAAKVVSAAREAPAGRSLVVMAHNGPAGMGAARGDPCGVDWLGPEAGDHGDADLRMALEALHSGGEVESGSGGGGGGGADGATVGDGGGGGRDGGGGSDRDGDDGDDGRRHVALVLHGHMHHVLRGGADRRRMVHVDAGRGTVVLNAATVPRVRAWLPLPPPPSPGEGDGDGGAEGAGGDGDSRGGALSSTAAPPRPRRAGATLRHFLVVELREAAGGGGNGGGPAPSAEVVSAEDVWVGVDGDGDEEEGAEAGDGDRVGADGGGDGGLPRADRPRHRRAAAVVERHPVLRTARGDGEGGGVLKLAWDASSDCWRQHVWRAPSDAGEGGDADAAPAAAAPAERAAGLEAALSSQLGV